MLFPVDDKGAEARFEGENIRLDGSDDRLSDLRRLSFKILQRNLGRERRILPEWLAMKPLLTISFKLAIPSIADDEHSFFEKATAVLSAIPGVRPIATAAKKAKGGVVRHTGHPEGRHRMASRSIWHRHTGGASLRIACHPAFQPVGNCAPPSMSFITLAEV